MAHHKSAIKRIKTNERDAERNKAYKTEMKTAIKRVRQTSNKEEGEQLYKKTASILDKLAAKRIINKNFASNQKSRLAAHVNKLE